MDYYSTWLLLIWQVGLGASRLALFLGINHSVLSRTKSYLENWAWSAGGFSDLTIQKSNNSDQVFLHSSLDNHLASQIRVAKRLDM